MSTLLPPPPRTGIDQYLQAHQWCRQLSNAIAIIQHALTRYGASEQEWGVFARYSFAVNAIAVIGQVAIDDEEQPPAGALPREECFALARNNLWTISAEIARWNPLKEQLLIQHLSLALLLVMELLTHTTNTEK